LAASDAAGHDTFSRIDKHVAAIQVPQDIVIAELTKKLVAPGGSDRATWARAYARAARPRKW
jgi:hypothetical protein